MVKTFKEFPGVEWVNGTSDFIKVDNQKCNGCMDCVKVCLAGCFEIIDKTVRVKSLEKCMECASCWYVCRTEAITFSWPKGGTGYQTDWG